MPQRPRQPVPEDGVEFAQFNNSLAKEKESDTRMKGIDDKNVDYKAIKRINKFQE